MNYVCTLFGAPIDAGGVSQVEYECIMNVCIYRRAAVLGALYMYVCMHVLCMYVCMYTIRRADRRAGWYRCVSNIICMYYDCLYVLTRCWRDDRTPIERRYRGVSS